MKLLFPHGRKFLDVRPDQYDWVLFAYMEGSNDETTLFVQFLDMIKNTGAEPEVCMAKRGDSPGIRQSAKLRFFLINVSTTLQILNSSGVISFLICC